jgi:hypothetical protein
MKKSSFEGLYVVAKFLFSKSPDGKINCISRTLGKFSVIDKRFKGKVDHKDLWVCKVIGEFRPGANQGAFILMPLEKIEEPENKIRKLIPGFYDVESHKGAVILTPQTDVDQFWIISGSTRKIFSKKYYAILVPINYEEKEVDVDLPVKGDFLSEDASQENRPVC